MTQGTILASRYEFVSTKQPYMHQYKLKLLLSS